MTVQVALLRGINVGGHKVLPMADLRAMLHGLGARDVATYIQSGNVVYRGDLMEQDLSEAIFAKKGFRPSVVILPFPSFEAVVAANPFPDAVGAPKALHVFFLASPSLCDPAVLEAAKGQEERVFLTERACYLHTPKFLSGSKLADKLERLLGMPATGRNWRSVEKLLAMGRALAD